MLILPRGRLLPWVTMTHHEDWPRYRASPFRSGVWAWLIDRGAADRHHSCAILLQAAVLGLCRHCRCSCRRRSLRVMTCRDRLDDAVRNALPKRSCRLHPHICPSTTIMTALSPIWSRRVPCWRAFGAAMRRPETVRLGRRAHRISLASCHLARLLSPGGGRQMHTSAISGFLRRSRLCSQLFFHRSALTASPLPLFRRHHCRRARFSPSMRRAVTVSYLKTSSGTKILICRLINERRFPRRPRACRSRGPQRHRATPSSESRPRSSAWCWMADTRSSAPCRPKMAIDVFEPNDSARNAGIAETPRP